MDGLHNCLEGKDPLRRDTLLFTTMFPKNMWYSLHQPWVWWKPESTLEPPSVLNMEPLDWQSSALTTGPLFNKKILKCASNGTF